ncbi:hypothetical protein ACFL0L_01610 [Patescibacteria group bacterium]
MTLDKQTNQTLNPSSKKPITLKPIIAILILVSIVNLFSFFTIGGCKYSLINLHINEVVPTDTIIEFECSGLNVNGEYSGRDFTIEGTANPSFAFGKSNINIIGNTQDGNQYEVSAYTRYNTIGIFLGLSLYSWPILIVVLVVLLIVNISRRRIKSTDL